MIKYIDYINESNSKNKYEIGDLVISKSKDIRYKDIYGKIGKIIFMYNNGNCTIEIDKVSHYVNIDDLEPVESDNKKNLKSGDRVLVNGTDSNNITYDNRKGTISKIMKNGILVNLDEDETRNLTSYSSFIKSDIIEKIEDYKFSIGDKVINKTETSRFFNTVGEIVDDFKDGSYVVKFYESNGDDISYVIHEDKLELYKNSNTAKSTDFIKKPETSGSKITNYEEEEEDDDDIVNNLKDKDKPSFKKEDLLDISYKDLLDDSKISDKKYLLELKSKYEKLSANDDNAFKKAFNQRALKNIEIVETYYDFLINKIAGDLPVYRTIEDINDEDLIKTKTKVRASDSKEISRKYSFDQGIIIYWKFGDAVIFKTI